MTNILAVLILFAIIVTGVTAQCVPDPVFYIYLDNTTLHWRASETCNGTSYIVFILIPDTGIVQYADHVEETAIDVSVLPLCTTYIFTISGVSENHVGPYSQILRTLQLPEGTDITITNFTGSQVDRDVYLQWEVLPQYVYCVDSYVLLVLSEDTIEEIITNLNEYYIHDVAQCMPYQFEIYVERSSTEHPVYRLNYTVPPATNSASLVNISQGMTSINTTWALESYSVNRCNVSALHVQGEQFDITIPIVDDPQRPNIDVNLSGLRSNIMYYFNVTVENEAGISKPFQLAVQTLPIETDLDIFIY